MDKTEVGALNKRLLDQYEDACRLVDETQRDLQKLKKAKHEIRQDIVKGSNPEYPYEQRHFHIEGTVASVYDNPGIIARTEKLLAERLERAGELELQVQAWMNEQPFKIQRIVRMRYLKRMTWEQVSANMGYNTRSAAKMVLQRHLENIDT